MFTGKDTLQVMNDHTLQTQNNIENTGQRLNTLNSRLNTLRLELAEQYRQLAKIRLDEIRARSLISRLDKADHTIVALLDKKAEAVRELESSLQESLARQHRVEEKREAQEKLRDSAIETLQRQLQETKARLEQTDSYQLQKRKVKQAVEVAERADEKASQAKTDRANKGKPYEDENLFIYLWRRQYLMPGYSANRFIRVLDEWVARLINFKEARANYHMLLELPLRLREHATKLREEAKREVQALQAMEKEAAKEDGFPKLKAEVDKAEKHLHQIDDAIDTGEAHHQKLLQQRAEFLSGDDDYSRKVINLLVAELEQEDIVQLHREALGTPRPEDDAIVARLRKLQDEQEQVSHAILSVKEEQQQQQSALAELEQLRRRFRRQSYDAYHSTFPANFGLALLLGQLMKGNKSSDTVWDEINRAQRFRHSPEVGDFGGFDTGRRFGGVDFRTGGGF